MCHTLSGIHTDSEMLTLSEIGKSKWKPRFVLIKFLKTDESKTVARKKVQVFSSVCIVKVFGVSKNKTNLYSSTKVNFSSVTRKPKT